MGRMSERSIPERLTGLRGFRYIETRREGDRKAHVFEDRPGSSGFMDERLAVLHVVEDRQGNYEAVFPLRSEIPFRIGRMTDFDHPHIQVNFFVRLKIDDPELFETTFGFNPLVFSDPKRIAESFLRPSFDARGLFDFGRVRMDTHRGSVVDLHVEGTIHGEEPFIREARDAYSDCWGDNDWVPRSIHEAAFEALLGSNANPSPSDCGYEIQDYSFGTPLPGLREPGDPGP